MRLKPGPFALVTPVRTRTSLVIAKSVDAAREYVFKKVMPGTEARLETDRVDEIVIRKPGGHLVEFRLASYEFLDEWTRGYFPVEIHCGKDAPRHVEELIESKFDTEMRFVRRFDEEAGK